MAFELKKKSKLNKQFKKMSIKMIDSALEQLRKRGASTRGRAVHDARKKFKQLRGLLRLLRFELGQKIYRKQNRMLRDAGRPLSEVRDADVMIETLDQLQEHFQKKIAPKAFRPLKKQLRNHRKEIRKRILVRERAMQRVSKIARGVRNRVQHWPKIAHRWKNLRRGVGAVYQQGRDEMKTAVKDPTEENYHAWRKSAKYLRYHLEILRRIWPEMMEPLAAQTRHLADILGLEHDLAVLRGLVEKECSDACDETTRELLLGLIHQRRSELQTESMVLGNRLYAETDKQFLKRLAGYWRSWQTGTPAGVF